MGHPCPRDYPGAELWATWAGTWCIILAHDAAFTSVLYRLPCLDQQVFTASVFMAGCLIALVTHPTSTCAAYVTFERMSDAKDAVRGLDRVHSWVCFCCHAHLVLACDPSLGSATRLITLAEICFAFWLPACVQHVAAVILPCRTRKATELRMCLALISTCLQRVELALKQDPGPGGRDAAAFAPRRRSPPPARRVSPGYDRYRPRSPPPRRSPPRYRRSPAPRRRSCAPAMLCLSSACIARVCMLARMC